MMMSKPGDEMFHWFNLRYNVTQIKNWISAHEEVKPRDVEVRKYAECMLAMSPKNLEPEGIMMHVNWEHVREMPDTALKIPIIGVMIPDVGTVFVDGNHRIARAYRDQKLVLPAYLLSATQAAAAQAKPPTRLRVKTSPWPGSKEWAGS